MCDVLGPGCENSGVGWGGGAGDGADGVGVAV